MRRLGVLLSLLILLSTASCASAGRLRLPDGPGEALPAVADLITEATAGCAGVQSATAELRLSGRAGSQRMRGTVLVGAARPDALRLEAVAPFGAPAFILVAEAGRATLLLPRDNRVLTGASAGRIIQALTGVSVTPAELLAILTGCAFVPAQIGGGRSYPGGWAVADAAGGRRLYLRRVASRWRLVAAARTELTIEYSDLDTGPPPTVRMIAREGGSGGAAVSDLVMRVSRLEIGVPLAPAAFTVAVPADAMPLTLEELRGSGPLGTPER